MMNFHTPKDFPNKMKYNDSESQEVFIITEKGANYKGYFDFKTHCWIIYESLNQATIEVLSDWKWYYPVKVKDAFPKKEKENYGINDLAKAIHKNAVEKGFYEDEKNIGEMLALIHAEVSEALEADRKGKYEYLTNVIIPISDYKEYKDSEFLDEYNKFVKGTFEEEMADIQIRVMDLCAYKCIDLENHILAKMRYNSLREYKHGKKY